jgi:2-dehydro-3-deoxyphosphooctonate aldolase (KDO 8-P synthase)
MSKKKFSFFIGPCVLESEELAMNIAEKLSRGFEAMKGEIEWVFKGSYDKANRTSVNSFRGPGLEQGLLLLEKIRKTFNVPVMTDFHLPDQATAVASVADIIQVPAFLCRQTDMILEGAKACQKHNRQLNIKKGQFLAPEDTQNIIEKASVYLPKEKIILTERGTSFGYNNLIVDMASFQIMKHFGVKAIYDATHSIQKPGGLGHMTGGKRGQLKVLARAAVAAGADGVFIETHPNPEKAMSDSETALPLSEILPFVVELLKIHRSLEH